MKKSFILCLVSLALLTACTKRSTPALTITTDTIRVDSTADAIMDMQYMEHLSPIKTYIDEEMSIHYGWAGMDMLVDSFECPMLNWAADVLLKEANRLYPGKVDIALLNRGGTRCSWMKGELTRGHLFKMMPFENKMVVLKLKGQDILDLFTFLAQGDAQGIAGMRVKFVHKQLAEITIGGKPVNPEATYYMATNSYLAKGKDGMTALKADKEPWDSQKLIRDIYIDAVCAQGTVYSAIDGRMMIEK